MCIAILKTPNGVVTKEELQTSFNNNPDMCGFGFVDEGQVYVLKGYDKFEEFYSDYEQVAELNDRNILIHFRISTSGKVDEDNCHPFFVKNDLILIHNGVLTGCRTEKDKNDTRCFIEDNLCNIPTKMWKKKTFRNLVGEAIGNSKFVLLDQHDNYYIINEDSGHWSNGCWFSNNSYKENKYKLYNKNNNSYYDSYYDYYDDYYKDTLVAEKCKWCGCELITKEEIDRNICDDCWEIEQDYRIKEESRNKDKEIYTQRWVECNECGESELLVDGEDEPSVCKKCGSKDIEVMFVEY